MTTASTQRPVSKGTARPPGFPKFPNLSANFGKPIIQAPGTEPSGTKPGTSGRTTQVACPGWDFIEFAAGVQKVNASHLLVRKAGKGGGTFAHWQIALAHAPGQHTADSRQEGPTGAKNDTYASGRHATFRTKPKGPVLENTPGYAVATPPEKRGFVMSESVRPAPARAGMVLGRMGLPVRMAARRIPCFQHPAHPLRLKTWRVVSESRYGAKTMTKAFPLVRKPAPTTPPGTAKGAPTPTPTQHGTDLVALHMVACNGLNAALRLLTDPGTTDSDAAVFAHALARAMRATTALKRACAELNGRA